jgi:hypothetical protein
MFPQINRSGGKDTNTRYVHQLLQTYYDAWYLLHLIFHTKLVLRICPKISRQGLAKTLGHTSKCGNQLYVGLSKIITISNEEF